jgi:hypothetical protein
MAKLLDSRPTMRSARESSLLLRLLLLVLSINPLPHSATAAAAGRVGINCSSCWRMTEDKQPKQLWQATYISFIGMAVN